MEQTDAQDKAQQKHLISGISSEPHLRGCRCHPTQARSGRPQLQKDCGVHDTKFNAIELDRSSAEAYLKRVHDSTCNITPVMEVGDKVDEVNDGKDPREKWDASTRPIFMKGDLPEPMYCDPMYCVVDEPPGCLNYELPTFGQCGPRVEDPDDDLNPYLGEVHYL
eukprot:scaffold33642_cov170-Skeletonema_dohrnii-CCMP3373.AAC.1